MMAKAKVQELKPINRKIITVRIVGLSPLIQHRWAEKAKEMMRLKHAGKKTRDRTVRDPEQEGKDAGYYTKDGKPALLAVAVKAAVISAAHQDLGIPKVLVRKSLFIYPMGRDAVVPLEMPTGKGAVKASIEEDLVRVGAGAADLRYRPYYYDWAATTKWELDVDLLQPKDLLRLLDRAGFGVGVHEWRPENGGDFGRFRVDEKFEMLEEDA